MAPYSLLFKNIKMEELEQMTYRELQQRSKSLHLPANFKKIYLIKLIYEKINGREEQVTRIINQAKYERLQAANNRKKKSQQFTTAVVIPTKQPSPPLTVTPKKGIEAHSVRPLTLNMSERVLRNRIDSVRFNQNNASNEGFFAPRVNPNQTPKIRFRTNGPKCAGIIVPRKLRRTGIPEFKEQLKSLQPIIFAHKNELQMMCNDKNSTMEIVLRRVQSNPTSSSIGKLNIAKNGHQTNDKKVMVLPSAAQKEIVDNVYKSLSNNTNCNNQRSLNSVNIDNKHNYDVNSCHNESNRMEYSDMNNYPNLQATFEEPNTMPPISSDCLTSVQVRSLNEHTPICNNFINNNTDIETPVTTCTFVVDYFQILNKPELDIYFNPKINKPLFTNNTKVDITNKNGVLYTGSISGFLTSTFIHTWRPRSSAQIVEKRTSCCWDLQYLQPHDIMFYQPRDINRENHGIPRNPLCIIASQVTRITEVQDDMDDALEVISQDGDYLSRLGMNIKVKCVFCAWESSKIQFDNHLRKEHSNLILSYNTLEWIISFNLEQLMTKDEWASILVQDHLGFLYIVSGKLHKLDYLMVSIATVTAEQENKEVSITAYNRQTTEPCLWFGEVQDFTAIDLNDSSSHIKIELSRLDIIPSGIFNQQLIIYSPSEPLETNVVLYVKV